MKLARILSLALMAVASAIPVDDFTSKADMTLAETVTDLVVRDEPKKPEVLESDPRTYILPFHLRLFEGCLASEPIALFTYSNGNIVIKDQPLSHHQIVAVDHRAPGFSSPLQLGPYDFAKSTIPFTHKKCRWNDAEWWKECGECRPLQWSAGPIDCKNSSSKVVSRTKDMDCSFLLAKQVSVE